MVSGLPAKNGVEDYILFQSFCEENLQCKPLLNAGKCRRIDKVQPGRVPRLLISFANQSARDDILARSNTLRLSSDSAVKSVYLNPDLSREQAQLAYENVSRYVRIVPLETTKTGALPLTTTITLS